MRSHQSMLLGLAVSMLMVLPESARDAVNSDSPIFLSQAGGDQPASGHVEAQGSGEKELHFPPLPPEWLPPWPMRPLPGLYAFRTYYGYNLSAVGGGGRTVDAIHTDVQMIGPWEKFRLWCCDPDNPQYFAIQTIGGRFLTAVDGGGRTTDTIRTNATHIQAWEMFRFLYAPWYAVQTYNGQYLTAVEGGNRTSDAIRTDATKVNRWERFGLQKCGDLGSAHQYTLEKVLGEEGTLNAVGGGGRSTASVDFLYNDVSSVFTILRQGDGSYALRTSNGMNYLTAIQGGGLASGDTLATDRTQSQAWEKFQIVDDTVEGRDCVYTIQTASGFFLGPGPWGVGISTRISDPNAAFKFELYARF
jgi:hypothetical protein